MALIYRIFVGTAWTVTQTLASELSKHLPPTRAKWTGKLTNQNSRTISDITPEMYQLDRFLTTFVSIIIFHL